MQVELKIKWLGERDFAKQNPRKFAITAVKCEKGKYGNDWIAELQSDGQFYQMSLWGDNLRTLVEKFGKESDNWIGKVISIKAELIAEEDGTICKKTIE